MTARAELLTDRTRVGNSAHPIGTVRSTVDAELVERLRLVARDRQMTLCLVLEAAFAVLVSRCSGSRDVVIGTPHVSSPQLIPLRLHLDPWASVDEALRQTRATCLAGFAQHDRKLEDSVTDPSPGRVQDRHPLFDLVFAMSGAPVPYPPLDLIVSVRENGDGRKMDVVLQYDADLFDETSITRLAAQWQRVLLSVANDPHLRVCDLELMSKEESQLLLAAGDRTAEQATFVPITALIAHAIVQHADEVAVELGDDQLTYRDLGRHARHLADKLGEYGVDRGDVVAVSVERSIALVIAQLAVLMHGAVLLPIDAEQPPRRIDAMLSDVQARLVLASDAGAIGLSNMLPVLDVVAELAGVPEAPVAASPPRELGPDDASYALFTSGSTGRPKGVVNTHGGIANRIAWMQDTYQLTRADRVLYKTPVTFDVAMWEWLWPLTVGAGVVVAESGAHTDPIALARAISEHGVTITHFVPSMLRLFVAQPEARSCGSLRQIVCSGEELTAVAVDEALRICPAVDNLYGPTEAAIDVTRWACGPGESRTPIGGPISGVCLRVVDETGGLVPVGVPGELLIGGVALARGYAFRPGLTGRAFIPDRWGDGRRLYRTGDRARWREPGVLEFLGRLDAQVKIRGVRVEPGEVESALGACPGVRECAVVVQVDEPRGPRLVAFVTGSAEPADLRGQLRTALPEIMVPTVIERIDAMPRTASGKIDRVDLESRLRTRVAGGSAA